VQFIGKLFNDDGPVLDAVKVTMDEHEKVMGSGRWTGTLHGADIDAGDYQLQVQDGRYVSVVVTNPGDGSAMFTSEGYLS